MINDPSRSYTYNAEGELTGVDTTATYAYDGHRWRMKKIVNGTTTIYIYSGSKVLAEYVNGAAPTAPTKEYVYSGGGLLTTLAGSTVTYHYPDHLSNRFETDSAGNVTRTFGHLPFGEIWYETGTPGKWKFTGYERDSTESGLDYALNRFYSNGYGRFQSADLYLGSMDLSKPQSLSRYGYVINDPTDYLDPSGLAQTKSDLPNDTWSSSGWTSINLLLTAATPTFGIITNDDPEDISKLTLYLFYGNWDLMSLIGAGLDPQIIPGSAGGGPTTAPNSPQKPQPSNPDDPTCTRSGGPNPVGFGGCAYTCEESSATDLVYVPMYKIQAACGKSWTTCPIQLDLIIKSWGPLIFQGGVTVVKNSCVGSG